MSRICLLTPGQPSTNPRLLKEADALVEAGHDVHVLCSHNIRWADESDRELLKEKKQATFEYVGGEPGSLRYWITRLRHGSSRRFPAVSTRGTPFGNWALSRVTPDLMAAAKRLKADLYIAHYTGALLPAAAAARSNNSLFAFDAEDFESGYFLYDTGPSPVDNLVQEVERDYLHACGYVTAASPEIARAYASKYSIPLPITVLNVFPLADRPPEFRPTAESGPLRLYWFSQTVGLGRGLGDVIRCIGRLSQCDIELHVRGRCSIDVHRALYLLADTVGVKKDMIVVHEPASPTSMVKLAAAYDVGLALEQPVSLNSDLCLSNKIFTYLLAGNAVAATATRAQKPVIDSIGRAGFVYNPGDFEALARSLRIWYDDRRKLHEARCEAWSLGTRRFNWDIEKKNLLGVVNRILTERRCVTSAT